MSLQYNNYTINLLLLTFSSFLILVNDKSSAQTLPLEKESDVIQEITVTVQRREQNILDVPYNITAVSGDEISASFTRDSAELLRSIPGVSQIDQGPRNAAQFSSVRIRGLNVDSSANSDYPVASVATVSTYLNETPVYANLALIDLDRVEVLRGPQATLYGSGALGGTIKYFLKEPIIGETEGSITTTFSSVNGSKGSLINNSGKALTLINNYPINDNVAIRMNFYLQDYPGITDYVNLYQLDESGVPIATENNDGSLSPVFIEREDADTYKSLYSRMSLLWIANDDLEFLINYLSQKDDIGGRRAQSVGSDGFGNDYEMYEQGAVILEPSDRDFEMFSIEATMDLNFATLTSATSLYDNDGSSETDNTGFYANNFADLYANILLENTSPPAFLEDENYVNAVLPFLYPPLPLYTADRTFYDKALVQELRLVGSINNQIDYVIGVFYRDNDRGFTQISDLVGYENFYDQYQQNFNLIDVTDNIFTYSRDENYKEKAAFSELTWHASEKLHLTLGMRHFDIKSTVSTFDKVSAYVDFSNPTTTNTTSSEHDILFKGNIAYDFFENDLLYMTISEGFRRGGNNAVSTEAPLNNDESWIVYDSDRVLNYEAGVKGILNEIRYDLSLFHIDWIDPQFNTSTPVDAGAFYSVVNGEEATTRGLELQISGELNDQLSYALGYAYVDAKLSADLLTPINTEISIDGSPLPGVPKHAINLAFDYFESLNADIDLAIRLDGFYQSKTYNVIETNDVQSIIFDGFQIWDTSASIVYDQWISSIFIKNIFNEEGVTGAFTEEAYGSEPSAYFYGSNSRNFIALPRTIGIAINYQF